MPSRTAYGILHILRGQLKGLGDFQDGGFTLKLLFQFGKGFIDLIDGTDLVEGKADNAGLFCQCLQDRLPDPPYRVADELEPPGLIKTLGRFDQAQVSLIDQVRQTESPGSGIAWKRKPRTGDWP
jgi:hypothetical protein